MIKGIGFLFLFISFTVFGQLPENEVLKNELTVGVNTNTNGGLISGINVRYTFKTAPKKYNLFEFELVNVKHEKEERFSSATSSSFIPGKLSYLIALRPSYGKEITLFEKNPENGIRLNFTYSGGPTFGIVKPYMIEYLRYVNSVETVVVEAYDPNKHSIGLIRGDAGILTGVSQSRVNVGAHARTSVNFEYGAFDNLKMGVETGITLEGYLKSNVLLVNNEKKHFYSAFFFHVYYGLTF